MLGGWEIRLFMMISSLVLFMLVSNSILNEKNEKIEGCDPCKFKGPWESSKLGRNVGIEFQFCNWRALKLGE